MKQIYYIFILSFLAISPMQPSFAASAAAGAGPAEDPRIAAIAHMSFDEQCAALKAVPQLERGVPSALYIQALNAAVSEGTMKMAKTCLPEGHKYHKMLEESAARNEAASLLTITSSGALDYMCALQEEVDTGCTTEPAVFSLIQREFAKHAPTSCFWAVINQNIIEGLQGDHTSLESVMGDLMWGKFFLGELLQRWMTGSPRLLAQYPDVKRIHQETISVMEDAMELLRPFMSDAYQADQHKMAYTAKPSGEGTVKRLAGIDDLEVTSPKGPHMRVPFQLGIRARAEKQFEAFEGFFTTDGYCFAYTLPSGFMGKLGSVTEAEAKALVAQFNRERDVVADEVDKRLVAAAVAEIARLKEAAKGNKAAAQAAEKVRAAAAAAEVEALLAAEFGDSLKSAGKSKRGGKGRPVAVAAAVPVPSPAPSPAPSMAAASGGAGGMASAATSLAEPLASTGAGSMPAVVNAMDAERAAFAARAADKKRLTEITLALWAAQDDEPALEMERPVASRAGLKARQKVALATLLGIRIGGQIHDINTLDWDKLVYLLKGLGFHQTDRDKFQNAEKQSINLHAIHYDDYRLNHAAKRIVLTQLEAYGLTADVLRAKLD